MTRKSFFKERSVREIRDLNIKPVYTQKSLVERIDDLNPNIDAIELRIRLTPGKFFRNTKKWVEASRKCYKHGDSIISSQPKTQKEAYACEDIPLAIRARDFSRLENMDERDINFVNYSFRPVQGTDRRKRVVPFVWIPESIRLFGYSEKRAGGIDIMPYTESKRVAREGATITCKVPSRTKKKPRYKLNLLNVPVKGNIERRAIAWGLKAKYDSGEEPEHSIHNIRYTYETDREGSEIITFYPHEMAAYHAVLELFFKQHNLTPMEMNPLPLISRKLAENYLKLRNNVIVYDPTLGGKDKFRKTHLDETSIFIARNVGVFGYDETLFWDPGRDGKFVDYNWDIPEK